MNFVDSNSFITSVVSSCIVKYQDKLDARMFDNKPYNLIITGTIGVGKSTILQLISEIFAAHHININRYPEYINFNKLGQKLFEMKMHNEVSTFTFQNYVIDVWDTLLTQNHYHTSNGINIFERIPYDAVYCFTKQEYENGSLTDDEYKMIEYRYHDIISRHDMFDYSDPRLKHVRVINDDIIQTIGQILDYIISDISHDVFGRVICLDVKDDIYYTRLGIRGRTAEDEYTKNVLTKYRDYYRHSMRTGCEA